MQKLVTYELGVKTLKMLEDRSAANYARIGMTDIQMHLLGRYRRMAPN